MVAWFTRHWFFNIRTLKIKVGRREQLYTEEQSLNASRLAIEDFKLKVDYESRHST